jgi:hypothetical protein
MVEKILYGFFSSNDYLIFKNSCNKLVTCNVAMEILKKNYSHVQLVVKKSGNENFPNVNLILSICQLFVYLTIPIK